MNKVSDFTQYLHQGTHELRSSLGPEEQVRERLKEQSFSPIDGGYQIRKVYLGSDLVLYVPKRREPIFWEDDAIERILEKPVLGSLYRRLQKMNSAGMYQLKQAVKLMMAVANKDPAAGPLALIRTLESYRRAERLEGVVDPFLILETVRVRTGRRWKRLCWVIVRERCDRSLLLDVQELTASGNLERAKSLIEQMIYLDEKMWSQGLLNRDCSLKNVRVREQQVVLRDAGQLTGEFAAATEFIEQIAWPEEPDKRLYCPVRKNLLRLYRLDEELARFYLDLGRQVYHPQNLSRCWPA